MDALMDSTFALRRKEIVDGEPPVSEIEARWPALFSERQISAEFMRLVSSDLHQCFFDGLDKYVPKLLEMYSIRSPSCPNLRRLLHSLDEQTSNQKRRAAVLLGLPHYLREDSSSFISVCETTSSEGVARQVDIGLLIVAEDGGSGKQLLALNIVDVAVVLEERVIVQELKDVPKAFATLMGLLYSLNMMYPKGLKYTFEVIQKVFMGIGSATCSAKVNGLRNKMLQA
ncbi:uncharacterized protein LOC130209778 [Pseudoliparis swirei]|uniref:uncharacterized protein LOC130209778 n=1 Tax=Pseudoliparis swirei TaxID=2059687 RepID=UPI0024BEC87C|nr:uncharacterized protein LOC130209778 [Pseudoliparis swirei]